MSRCYIPTPYYKILKGLSFLKSVMDPGKSVFIDIGSGAGRVLFVAALEGFRYVLGIELSRSLCDLGDCNFNNYFRGDSDIDYRTIHSDLGDIEFNAFIEDKYKGIESIVVYIGGTYAVGTDKLDELTKFKNIDIYILNIGPVGSKQPFEDKGFSIIYEKIRNRSKPIQRHVKFSDAFQTTYDYPYGYRIYKRSRTEYVCEFRQ